MKTYVKRVQNKWPWHIIHQCLHSPTFDEGVWGPVLLFLAFALEALTVLPETEVGIGLVMIQSLGSAAASFSSDVAFLFSCRSVTDLLIQLSLRIANNLDRGYQLALITNKILRIC
jgi:hypothetical protein